MFYRSFTRLVLITILFSLSRASIGWSDEHKPAYYSPDHIRSFSVADVKLGMTESEVEPILKAAGYSGKFQPFQGDETDDNMNNFSNWQKRDQGIFLARYKAVDGSRHIFRIAFVQTFPAPIPLEAVLEKLVEKFGDFSFLEGHSSSPRDVSWVTSITSPLSKINQWNCNQPLLAIHDNYAVESCNRQLKELGLNYENYQDLKDGYGREPKLDALIRVNESGTTATAMRVYLSDLAAEYDARSSLKASTDAAAKAKAEENAKKVKLGL